MHEQDHRHRGGAGGFDLDYVVPGLAFFEEFAGHLCRVLERALELTGEAYRGARRLARRRPSVKRQI